MKQIFFLLTGICIGAVLMFSLMSNRTAEVLADCQDKPCTAPPCCNGDVNGDASIDISDAVFILNYLFSGGVEPISLPPKSPENISCIYSGETVQLSWSNSDNYESIEVQKNGNVMVTLPGTATTYQDDQVEEGNIYSYALIGIAGKESSPTVCAIKITAPCPDCDSCCPPAPPTITDCSYSDGAVHVIWENNDSYTSIEINGDPIAGESTELEDSSVAPGASYTYSIVGISDAGTSAPVMCWINIPEECQPCDSCCKLDSDITVILPGNSPLEMVYCPAGTFMMGAKEDEQDSDEDEKPRHEVTLTNGFYLGKYEVTKRQWVTVMGTTPWAGMHDITDTPQSPAVYVGLDEVQEFISELNKLEQGTFRLPTEAEWEYACRAGTSTRFYWGDDPDYTEIGNYAWYHDNTWEVGEEYAHIVGQKLPNNWGLYDMGGNADEWCQDWYGEYSSDSLIDPIGPEESSFRVSRGGTGFGEALLCCSAHRTKRLPDERGVTLGFRVVFETTKNIDLKSPVLPATGQETCYDARRRPTDCSPGQDGYYQAGCPMEGRFHDNGDGTVTDNCTQLMWQKSCGKWFDADGPAPTGYCESLELASYTDWRLPNVRELQSIIDYGRYRPALHPVFDGSTTEQDLWYMSSTYVLGTNWCTNDGNCTLVWIINFYDGNIGVIPVRSQTAIFLSKTAHENSRRPHCNRRKSDLSIR